MQLPLQGAVSLPVCLPKAMPWADSSCPFGAQYVTYMQLMGLHSGRGIPQWLRRGRRNYYPICNEILPKNGSLIFCKPGARKAQKLIFLHNLAALAQQEKLCSFPKAPFLHSQSGALGLPEHSIWYTKSTAFRVQERCFGNARTVLLFGKNYTFLILKWLC